jgi:hypothetical protein
VEIVQTIGMGVALLFILGSGAVAFMSVFQLGPFRIRDEEE